MAKLRARSNLDAKDTTERPQGYCCLRPLLHQPHTSSILPLFVLLLVLLRCLTPLSTAFASCSSPAAAILRLHLRSDLYSSCLELRSSATCTSPLNNSVIAAAALIFAYYFVFFELLLQHPLLDLCSLALVDRGPCPYHEGHSFAHRLAQRQRPHLLGPL